jgi:hypothetical protein
MSIADSVQITSFNFQPPPESYTARCAAQLVMRWPQNLIAFGRGFW